MFWRTKTYSPLPHEEGQEARFLKNKDHERFYSRGFYVLLLLYPFCGLAIWGLGGASSTMSRVPENINASMCPNSLRLFSSLLYAEAEIDGTTADLD